jgi:hypothetical protein
MKNSNQSAIPIHHNYWYDTDFHTVFISPLPVYMLTKIIVDLKALGA